MPVGSTKAGAARLLLIVSRTERLRYAYLKYIFDDETGDVIVDRRVGERRRRQEPAAVEKRRGDRRERDITKDLEISGDRKSTRLNSSHSQISYAVFCLKKK